MSVGVDKVVKDAEFAELLDESVGDERGRLGSFVDVQIANCLMNKETSFELYIKIVLQLKTIRDNGKSNRQETV